ncbi:hypothetical protein Tco_0487920 [Tanacetum coccineum]
MANNILIAVEEEEEEAVICRIYTENLRREIPLSRNVVAEGISTITSQLAKLNVLDIIPALMGKVATALDRFAIALSSASQQDEASSVPLVVLSTPTPRTEGEQNKDKGKKAMSPEDIVGDEESESDSNAESIQELAKAELVRFERKSGKHFLIKALGQDVVEKFYKDKVKYDKYYLNMLNRMAKGKITNCDVLTKGNGPINMLLRLVPRGLKRVGTLSILK